MMGSVVISLEEVKAYLRVENESEDTLITSFIKTSQEMCEGILRYSLSELEVVPDTIKQAICYGVACFYEQREKVDAKEVLEMMKYLLLNYRKEGW